ncbi:MAG TPA: metallophosphoesterase [Mycobacteriales bacterium]|nr:metallophosphoesterase [Mycobacteriales bacterium]
MKIAVFSDVHGNALALDAVLADAQAAGAEEFWVVGDLVSDGPRPADVITRLKGLPGLASSAATPTGTS